MEKDSANSPSFARDPRSQHSAIDRTADLCTWGPQNFRSDFTSNFPRPERGRRSWGKFAVKGATEIHCAEGEASPFPGEQRVHASNDFRGSLAIRH